MTSTPDPANDQRPVVVRLDAELDRRLRLICPPRMRGPRGATERLEWFVRKHLPKERASKHRKNTHEKRYASDRVDNAMLEGAQESAERLENAPNGA